MLRKLSIVLLTVLVLVLGACGNNADEGNRQVQDKSDTSMEAREAPTVDSTVESNIDTTDSDIDFSQLAYDYLGAYKGVAINVDGTQWADTFGTDDWEFNENVQTGVAVLNVLSNTYEGVKITVFSQGITVAEDGSIRMLFKGYFVSASKPESILPDITWNGLTFGATAEDIIAAYGTPRYIHDLEEFITITYAPTYGIELIFYVYPDNGLRCANINIY